MIRPRLLATRPHVRRDQLGQPRQAEDVDLELAAGLVDRHVLDRTVGAVARVVHQYVDPPALVDDPLDAAHHGRVVGDVHPEDVTPCRARRGHPLDPAGHGVHLEVGLAGAAGGLSPIPLEAPVTRATRLLMWSIIAGSTSLSKPPPTVSATARSRARVMSATVASPASWALEPDPGRLGGVDAEAAAGAAVLGVLQRDGVTRRTAAGEEVEHHGVVGHGLEDPADQPGRLRRLEDVADDLLELGDGGVGGADLLGQPDRAQLLAAAGVQPVLLEDVDPLAAACP